MSRLMSVSHTEAAVVARRKTVTRRLGWTFLRPGDHLTLCRKVMGRKPGEPLVRIAEVEVTSVTREALGSITPADVRREGFTEPWEPSDFVWFFAQTFRVPLNQIVTRIEWRYL